MAKTSTKKTEEAQTDADSENVTNEQAEANSAKKVKLVKMVNEEGKEADVHPDEVHNFAKGGYIKKDA